jgi:phospholipid/cholesterol/gamma-HCH transport system substrate-binding protein
MRDETKRNLRVGVLTIVALIVAGMTIVFIGSRQQLFVRHTRYKTSFNNVTGLEQGSPVKLNGVSVGFVEDIELSDSPEDERITVRFTVNARFTERIREDSLASVRTMGLLGDRYVEISSGSAAAERLLEGGLIPGRDPAELSKFMASGGDLLENLLSISNSLKLILNRVEGGEGLLGELTKSPESGRLLVDEAIRSISAMGDILERIERGDGLLGQLIQANDPSADLLTDIKGTSDSVRAIAGTVAADLERSDTMYAALVRDPEGARRVSEALESASQAAEALAAFATDMAEADGTLPRLMQDREYADDMLEDFHALVASLRSIAEKLDAGDGTAGAFINDEQLYTDLEDVVRGVKDNRVVSWFIRRERRKGEEIRLEEAETSASEPAGASP